MEIFYHSTRNNNERVLEIIWIKWNDIVNFIVDIFREIKTII